MGIEAGAMDEIDQGTRREGTADARLEQHRIARDERLDELNTRKQQRVIAGADNQHDAQRFAANFTAHPRKPERKAASSKTTRSEKLRGVAFKKATGFGKGKNFRSDRFERRTLARRGRGFRENGSVIGDEPP